jgi:hypothetical protein
MRKRSRAVPENGTRFFEMTVRKQSVRGQSDSMAMDRPPML